MWSATRHPRVVLAMAAATVVLLGAACGGDDGGDGPTRYPTPSNLGFGVPIYPGAEYLAPPRGETTLHVIVPGGRSYNRQSHEFSVGEPWADVTAWYRDTFDAPGWEMAGPEGRVTTIWTIDRDKVGWTDIHVAETGPAVTGIVIYRNTYVVSGDGDEPTPPTP